MQSNNKTVIYVVIVLVVLIALGYFFAKKNDTAVTDSNGTMTATTTDTNNGKGAGAGTKNGNTSNNNQGNSGLGGTPAPAAIPSDATLMAIMNNSKLRVPGTGVDVALTAGRASFTNGSTKGTVALGSIFAKVSTNDGYDVFVNLGITTTGTINYVALFHVKGDVATYTSSVSAPTGAVIQSVEAKADTSNSTVNNAYPYLDSAAGYTLNVKYLGYKNGEAPNGSPTVQKDFTARVKNHIVSSN